MPHTKHIIKPEKVRRLVVYQVGTFFFRHWYNASKKKAELDVPLEGMKGLHRIRHEDEELLFYQGKRVILSDPEPE